MFRFIPLATLLLTACHTGIDFHSVDHDNLLNDQNSKVWLVDKVIMDNASIGPYGDLNKDVIIFYQSGNFQYSALRKLGTEHPEKGDYYLDSRKMRLTMTFNDDANWVFNIGYVEPDSILLHPDPASDLKYSLKIVPLPEF